MSPFHSSRIDASSCTASIWRSLAAAKPSLRLAYGLPFEFKSDSCSIKVMIISYARRIAKVQATYFSHMEPQNVVSTGPSTFQGLTFRYLRGIDRRRWVRHTWME